MPGVHSKKRNVEDGMRGRATRPVKKFKKQTRYDSDSSADDSGVSAEPDFQAVSLQDSDEDDNDGDQEDEDINQFKAPKDVPETTADASVSEATDASNSDSSSDSDGGGSSNPNLTKKRKRNDPEAFSTSMSKILSTKLSTSKRSDPVLSRSKAAIETAEALSSSKLEAKAKHRLLQQKKASLDRGRVKDVLGLDNHESAQEGQSVGETLDMERRLRKTAQRGVVKLFNAVRAAQVKGEQAAREVKSTGVVGSKRREEKVSEMSKRGFLDLVAGGGVGKNAGGLLAET